MKGKKTYLYLTVSGCTLPLQSTKSTDLQRSVGVRGVKGVLRPDTLTFSPTFTRCKGEEYGRASLGLASGAGSGVDI